MLTRIWKHERINSSHTLLAMCQVNEENNFGRLITQDGKLFHYYAPDVHVQSKQSDQDNSSYLKKAPVQPAVVRQ